MAAGTIAAPGTHAGPCEGECAHTDCAKTREMAATICGLCQKPIGYDRRFYSDTFMGVEALYHAPCLEDEIASQRQYGDYEGED